MKDFVVPLVCSLLWLCTWLIGYGIYRCKNKFSDMLTHKPKNWPLTNTTSFFVELLSLTAAVVAFLEVQSIHRSTPVKYFNSIVGLNISVYALLLFFLLVYAYDIMKNITNNNKKLLGTFVVVISYNACQLALVCLYASFLNQHQEPMPLVLSLFVFVQKSADIYWVILRRRDLQSAST